MYCVLIGFLVFRSRFLPRALGVLMVAGGLGYMIESFASVLAPGLAARLPDLPILDGVAELLLSLWLMWA